MNKTLLVGIFLCFAYSHVYSQYADTLSVHDTVIQKTNYKQLILIGTVVPVTTAAVYYYMNHAWWSDKKTKFHISDKHELKYALNLDKAGHFFSSYFVSTVFGDALYGTGLTKNTSVWGGAGLSILNATIVEIKDGVSPYWGFSMYDMVANVTGAMLPVLQHYVPIMQNFHVSWSYDFTNSSYYKTLPGNENKTFIDDYERHNYWFSIDAVGVYSYIKTKRLQPFYIMPALALSAQNIDGKGGGQHEWFIGMHINLPAFARESKGFLKYALRYVNFYHLPAPALRVKPQTTPYILTY